MCSTAGVRWDEQRVDRDEPALLGLSGLIRSVRSPEFAGVVFHEVRAKSVLNKVPGGSPMPFGWTVNPYRGCTHACVYCLDGETPILLADGSTKTLARLEVGDDIVGTQAVGAQRRYVRTKVLAHWRTTKRAYRITLHDGTEIVASGDHRFLAADGWRHVTGSMRPHLTVGARLVGTGMFSLPPEETESYQRGYLCGMVQGGGTQGFRVALAGAEGIDRTERYLSELGTSAVPEELPLAPGLDWHKGLLAGIFDARGSVRDGVTRIFTRDARLLDAICLALKELDFSHQVSEDRRAVILTADLGERLRFRQTVGPAMADRLAVDGELAPAADLIVTNIERLETRQLYDITTGTGDFIADGVVSHNCFARNTHTYLDLDSGHDFDSQVVVKVNAAELLRAKLSSPRWTREHVAMGTNTDPYQRAEGRYRLMPGIIRALADTGTPFSILTKGTTLSRDIPLLAEAAKRVPVGLGVSIALLDKEIHRTLEPGTPTPQARLELVRRITDAGLPCGVFIAPVLPGLTDSEQQLDDLLGAIAEAGATGVSTLALHLRPGAKEWFAQWLKREHPSLLPGYRQLYGNESYADRRYRNRLAARVEPLVRKHGLAPKVMRNEPSGVPGDQDATWPAGALPVDAVAPVHRVDQEQLTLL
ncbi:intein-containing Rv2578c family radical SAM protein [Kutzneria sp. NPDC051319]|uniref:intein-containing Rv2578c family radical SAM protein n=1 Tax=Kutzneria sp. NPDC051319 TaxID=3155047 RepID=UPI003445827F